MMHGAKPIGGLTLGGIFTTSQASKKILTWHIYKDPVRTA
jgi:hypothetical protein